MRTEEEIEKRITSLTNYRDGYVNAMNSMGDYRAWDDLAHAERIIAWSNATIEALNWALGKEGESNESNDNKVHDQPQ